MQGISNETNKCSKHKQMNTQQKKNKSILKIDDKITKTKSYKGIFLEHKICKR